MTILVDAAIWPWRGRRWAHLVSDHSLQELHWFATAIGKLRVSFQGDHYDVHEDDRECAIAAGATAVDSRDVVRALRVAGLRRRPSDPKIDWSRNFNTMVTTRSELLEALGRMDALPGGADLANQAELLISQARLADGPTEVFTLRGSVDLALAISAPHKLWHHEPDLSTIDVAEAYTSRRGDMLTVELLTGPGTAR